MLRLNPLCNWTTMGAPKRIRTAEKSTGPVPCFTAGEITQYDYHAEDGQGGERIRRLHIVGIVRRVRRDQKSGAAASHRPRRWPRDCSRHLQPQPRPAQGRQESEQAMTTRKTAKVRCWAVYDYDGLLRCIATG